MDFEKMMHTWNTQTTALGETDRRKLSDYIQTQINTGNRSERRLAFFATLIATTAAIWIVFWVTQLATVGVVALRAQDFLPPIGIALITPAWVGFLAATVSANYFIQKSRRRVFEDTLIGSVSRAQDQTQHQIKLWRVIPIALASCVLVGALSVGFSSQFTHAFGVTPLGSLVVFVPDLAILTYIFIRGRRITRTKLRPQLHETESILAHLRSPESEV